MPGEKDIRGQVKEAVKDLTAEIISAIVSRTVKAGTRQAINELKKKLGETTIARLQQQLETISGEKIDTFLKDNIDGITSELTKEDITKEQIIKNTEKVFRQRLNKYLSNMVKLPVLKILIVSIVLTIVIGILVIIVILTSGNDDTIPPELELYISPEIPRPDERVTFVVEAFDDSEIDWIELVINGEIVREGGVSPMVFIGGPYEEGATVVYSARAYDEAGNEASSGKRTFKIALFERVPDLVILEVSHEWIDIRSGLCVIRYIIQNRGDGEAGPNLTILRFGGEIIGEDMVMAMEPGATLEREFPPVELPPKEFIIEICSDFDNMIEEINENNNCVEYGP